MPLVWGPPIERGTNFAGDAVGLSESRTSPFVGHRYLALAAVSFPPLVPHLLHFLFNISLPIFL